MASVWFPLKWMPWLKIPKTLGCPLPTGNVGNCVYNIAPLNFRGQSSYLSIPWLLVPIVFPFTYIAFFYNQHIILLQNNAICHGIFMHVYGVLVHDPA